MDRPGHEPWNPDRRWADPFIATLALLIVLAVGATFRVKHARVAPPADHAELQGRLADVALAAPKVLGALAGASIAPKDALPGFIDKTRSGWDRAILAVHAAEKGDLAQGRTLGADAPGDAGQAFRAAWSYAYDGAGAPVQPADMAKVRRALGDGYAAAILEARCASRAGADPKPFEKRAADWVIPRLAGLIAAGLGGFLVALAGLGFLVFLVVSKAPPRAMPRFAMSGRAALIVLLGWFLTHLVVGAVISPLLGLFPFLRPAALPLVYATHALLGTGYLCWAEGLDLRTLAARLAPGGHGRALLNGLGFFTLAFAVVVAVTIAVSPLLRAVESPQRELLDMLSRVRGSLTVVLMFLTVAVLAPVFEELLFRGFMLPWLGERLEAAMGRRWGWIVAVAVTGLTFGAMHMQPLGMPTLGTLGIVLGFAFLRTGNLLTSILVHGLWNGGIFLLLRLVA